MRAIVTGGFGFIGSHLVDRLIKDGWSVLVIDNMVSGDNSNLKQPVDLLGKDLAKCQEDSFPGYDAIFHMAAYPIRRDKLFDYKIYFEQTEGGALAALEIARKNSIPVFVMPASTTLYGSAKYLGVVPTAESYIGSDISFYGTSKFNCVYPTAKVWTEDGWKAIKDIREGELVWTHRGRLRKVIKVFHHVSMDPTVTISVGDGGGGKALGFPSNARLTATTEHPVLTKDGWKKIAGLKMGDAVSVPAVHCLGCGELKPYWSLAHRGKCQYKAYPNHRFDMARKGHTDNLAHLRNNVEWRNKFALAVSKNKKMNSHEFYISLLIKEAAGDEEFQFAGNGSKIIGGYVPDFVSEKLHAIIEYVGYRGTSGRNPEREKRRFECFKKAGYQMLVLTTNEDFTHPEDAMQKIRSFVSVCKSSQIILADSGIAEFVFAPIRKITGHPRKVQPFAVYNLEVEEDNSYICNGVVVHNSERWCEAYAGLFDMNVLITRFGRILGPRSRNGSVWELVHRLKDNPARLEVLGDGSASRSFLHVDDCVEGMMVAMQHRSSGVDRFNISNSDIATVKDLVDILVEESGWHPDIVYGTEKVGWKGDNEMVYPDASKLRSFGWAPKRDSRETIRDCVRWTLANAD